ncbi:uncharacterized protein LOC143034751 [Oratosquilla oratoria]|uniref:uncharacterized protein LOC143034751 n=1 Tax=Oratosquilla oratoria TaxID=337810 RepID=UPI003F76F00E
MEPTRRSNILDLFFTNSDESISNCRLEKTISSDHNLIRVNTTYMKSRTPREYLTPPDMTPLANFNFFSQKVDWEQLQQGLRDIDWKLALQETDPNSILNTLLMILLEVCTAYVPQKKKKKVHKHSIPRDRKILMRKRVTLNKQLSKSSNETQKLSILSKVEDIEQKSKHSHEEQRRMEENQALENIKHNPKFFYSYCKKFLKTKSQIGPLVTDQRTTTDDPRETCQMLTHQYNIVFSIPKKQSEIPESTTFFNQATTNQTQLTDLQVAVEDSKKATKELWINSAAGPNGVPAILVLQCSEVIEKCVRDKLFTHLEVKNLIKENQHGFRKDRSCLSNLLAHYDWLLRNLSEGKNVDVVFLDFAKAFDKVDHGALLHKAKDLGISGKLGVWLHNFLTDRT